MFYEFEKITTGYKLTLQNQQDIEIADAAIAPHEVLTVKGLGEYLSLSESIVRTLVREQEVPYLRIRGSIRFYLPSIRTWLQTQEVSIAHKTDHKEIAQRILEN